LAWAGGLPSTGGGGTDWAWAAAAQKTAINANIILISLHFRLSKKDPGARLQGLKAGLAGFAKFLEAGWR
jgi:hypothetical protein